MQIGYLVSDVDELGLVAESVEAATALLPAARA